ncbi:MAG: 4Fe-4S double cluster binding domain-containing protein [Oscillospiraceae bacterium]|nr:4Fe-4S double cluster binding domain-containing protein [Oscillospiraceae bacterium]
MKLQEELKKYLIDNGASDVGFAKINDSDTGLGYAVSVVVRLSAAIVDEITDEPTHTYFNHYRSVNALIDQLLLKAGLFLQCRGYRYITVAASQSINKDGWNYKGRYSHKEAARLAGLGSIGKNSMFIHKDFGCSVRLGTLFTDCVFETPEKTMTCVCGECRRCVEACPAGAISGKSWEPGVKREEMFDPEKCSNFMKQNFKHIGRGAVCGICMKVCPKRS